MDDLSERWETVGELIEEALRELPESISEVSRRLGISPNKFRELREGRPGNYRNDTLVKVSVGLWDDPKVIRRILDGEDPRAIPAVRRHVAGLDWRWAMAQLDELNEMVLEAMTEAIEGGQAPDQALLEQLISTLDLTLASAHKVYRLAYGDPGESAVKKYSWRSEKEKWWGRELLGLNAALDRFDAALKESPRDERLLSNLRGDILQAQGRVTAAEREILAEQAKAAGLTTEQDDDALALAAERGDVANADDEPGSVRPRPAVGSYEPVIAEGEWPYR